MLNPSLRCILGLAVTLACVSPAAAQRASDPLTRFFDGVFKGNSASGGGAQTPEPAQEPEASPEPTPARPRPQAPAQANKPAPKPKAVTQKPQPAAPASAQAAKPQPQPQAAQPAPERPAVRDTTEKAKAAAPQPQKSVAEPPAQAAGEPKPVEAKPARVAEPPKPAKSTPAQAPVSTPVAASSAPVTPTSPPVPTPEAALDRVNAYFNSIDQMSAYFVQRNPNGQQAEGTLSMRRPGQLQFAYAPPSTLEVVSDGRNVAIRDKKLGTNDVYPVSQTPLKFLVQDHIDLARDTKVRDVQVGRDGMVTVRFDDSATLGGTSKITLRFDSRANALRQWTIVDAQGYETSVTLSGLNVVPRRGARAVE